MVPESHAFSITNSRTSDNSDTRHLRLARQRFTMHNQHGMGFYEDAFFADYADI